MTKVEKGGIKEGYKHQISRVGKSKTSHSTSEVDYSEQVLRIYFLYTLRSFSKIPLHNLVILTGYEPGAQQLLAIAKTKKTYLWPRLGNT